MKKILRQFVLPKDNNYRMMEQKMAAWKKLGGAYFSCGTERGA
jgi:hypothetical protein